MKLTTEQKAFIDSHPHVSSRQIAVQLFGKVKRKSTINDYRKQQAQERVGMSDYTSKILFIDIETSLQVAYAFGRFDINLSETDIIEHTKLLCAVAKWGGSDETIVVAPTDYSKWNSHDQQREMVQKLWRLIDAADVVVAHNISFDEKVLNTFFIMNGMRPPSSYRTLCTLRAARQKFKFFSNKLGDLAKLLELEYAKQDAGGKQTWINCHQGDAAAFAHMIEYNKYDVLVLEELYIKLSDWVKLPPIVTNGGISKPEGHLVSTGKLYTTPNGLYEVFEDCRGVSYRSKINLLEKDSSVVRI